MFSITRDDLKKYEKIGTGKYGNVYRINSNNVIKVYLDTINGIIAKELIINPALKVSRGRLRRIKKRALKVNNTDLPRDIVVIDGYFYGFVLPYYEGQTLNEARGLSYDEKKYISAQVINNDKELDENKIYPIDYHTDNIMVVDGKPKIIDIDDPLTYYTRLPNLALSKTSMGRLNETIQDFYDEFDLSLYDCYTMSKLQRERPKYSFNRDWLDDYLKDKEAIQDYLIIDEDTDLDLLKELLRNHKFRVLYLMKEINKDEAVRIINHLIDSDIELFDFIIDIKDDRFFSDFPVKNKILVKKDTKVIK